MAAVSRGVRTAAARQQQRDGRGRAAALLARIARPVAPLPPLPPPMVVDNYEANATSCHMQARFRGGRAGVERPGQQVGLGERSQGSGLLQNAHFAPSVCPSSVALSLPSFTAAGGV